MENREAIELIKRVRSGDTCPPGWETLEAFDMAISALEKQEKDRWIPVTERPPEVGQSVMITVAGIYTAEGCLKDDGNWCQFRWSAEHKPAIVGAWKPLPEPYTEEES